MSNLPTFDDTAAAYIDQSLLPKNSTPLEKLIERQAMRIREIPVMFYHLIDAHTCPVPFLPWLAWARRVEYWNGEWSEAIKRQVIKDARTFNEQRGTESTLSQAMQNLGLGHKLTAWHELSPKGEPFTFTVGITSGRVTVQQQQEIYTALNSVKSARDLFSIDASVVTDAQFFIAGACRVGETVHIATKPNL